MLHTCQFVNLAPKQSRGTARDRFNQSINLFSNKWPKGFLQIATKYKLTFTEYQCQYTHLHIHTHTYIHIVQGCPQDVKSQDRDETETVNLQDRDETEMFHFFKLSRPRRDRDVEPSRPRRDQDVHPSRPRRDETFQKTSRDRLETETFKTETTSLNIHNALLCPCGPGPACPSQQGV